jgi:hypothetical protein
VHELLTFNSFNFTVSGTPVLSSLITSRKTLELFSKVDSGYGPMVSVGITLQLPDAVLEAVLDALLATELAAELLVLDATLDVLFALEPFEPPPPQPIKPVAPKTLTAPSVPRALRRVISIPWSAELFVCVIVEPLVRNHLLWMLALL